MGGAQAASPAPSSSSTISSNVLLETAPPALSSILHSLRVFNSPPVSIFVRRGRKQLLKRELPDDLALKRGHGFERLVLLPGDVDGQAAHGDPLLEEAPTLLQMQGRVHSLGKAKLQ
jgi:hypothetical protein